jgi:hypothetical protein
MEQTIAPNTEAKYPSNSFAATYLATLEEQAVAYIESNDNYRMDGDFAALLRSYKGTYIISLPISASNPDPEDPVPVLPALLVMTIDDGNLVGQDILLVDDQHRAWGLYQALVKLQSTLNDAYYAQQEANNVFVDVLVDADAAPAEAVLVDSTFEEETDRETLVNLLVRMKERSSFPYEIDLSEEHAVTLVIDADLPEKNRPKAVFLFNAKEELEDVYAENAQ